jgi:dihydroorotase
MFNKVTIPGITDLRCFIGEPGFEYRETLASASASALAGGITTLCMQPNTSPVIDDPALVDFVKRRAIATAKVRVLPMAAITKGCLGEELAEMGLLLEAGAVAFTDGYKSIQSSLVMKRALTYARDFDALIIHHLDDTTLTADGVMNEGEFSARLGLSGISPESETIMLMRDLALVKLTKARYHAAGLSCEASVLLIKQAKEAGLNVTASVSINNLSLNENDVAGYKTFAKLSPPLRREEDRVALVEGVRTGVIDCITSDHRPQDVEAKRLPFAESAYGAVGLETLLPAALRLVHDGSLTLEQLVNALCHNPARLLGVKPLGEVHLDLHAPWVLDGKKLLSKCKNTPFDEARFSGKVMGVDLV